MPLWAIQMAGVMQDSTESTSWQAVSAASGSPIPARSEWEELSRPSGIYKSTYVSESYGARCCNVPSWFSTSLLSNASPSADATSKSSTLTAEAVVLQHPRDLPLECPTEPPSSVKTVCSV